MAEISEEQVERFVIDTLATFGPERDAVVRSSSLEELDLDSLDIVELAQVLEDEFEIEVKPERYEGSKTVGDVLDHTLAIVREA